MLLSEIKSFYSESLIPLYPKEEIESIFSLASEYVLNYSKIDIHRNLHKSIQPEAEKKMMQILSRLEKGEPIQYISGYTEFYDLKFIVDQRVLIPRQETELLVDIIIKDNNQYKFSNVIDLCTGSGCIAIALSKNLPEANITATDIYNNSIEVAKMNAESNQCKIQFIQDDILQPAATYNKYDCIVSNPPYVRNSEKQYMHQNVLAYEPSLALFVEDSDPLVFYRAIELFARKHLNPGGEIYLEINESFGEEMRDLMEKSNFHDVRILKDLQNKNRYLTARK